MESRFRDFTLLLLSAERSINKIKNAGMREFGLRGTQVNCLLCLYKNKNGLTAKDICAICKEDKASVSRILKELEQKEYVCYEQELSKKKYNSIINLTPKGKELAELIISKIKEIVRYDEDCISKEEIAVFYQTFFKICENLKEISKKCEGKND